MTIFSPRILAACGLLLSAGAAAQHPFQRLAVLSGSYAELPEQTASNGPEFGFSVAVSGDWLAVGAPGTILDTGGARRGAVFLFRSEGETWHFEKRIAPLQTEAPGPDARCGHSVALSGPYLAVGCPGAGLLFDPDNENGAMLIYRRDGRGSWHYEQSAVGGSGERCGTAVDISYTRVAVSTRAQAVSGCPGYSTGQGQVRSYAYDGDNWSQDATVTASNGAGGDGFGTALALHRTCSELPFPNCSRRLAVGAPNKQHGSAILGGAVYVFAGGGWGQTDVFTHPSPTSFGATFYGRSVDLNANQLLIGSPGGFTSECPNAPRCGLVNHYELNGTTWSSVGGGGAINSGGVPPGEQANMAFGRAVALGFDNWIAVAAPLADGPGSGGSATADVGMIELRRNDNGDWGASWSDYQGEFRPNPAALTYVGESHFGNSLAFGGDRWLAVGYPRARTSLISGARRGQVWMYAQPDGVFADRFEQ